MAKRTAVIIIIAVVAVCQLIIYALLPIYNDIPSAMETKSGYIETPGTIDYELPNSEYTEMVSRKLKELRPVGSAAIIMLGLAVILMIIKHKAPAKT